jgi:hypothetical protein
VGVDIDKDVVRPVFATRYPPSSGDGGPSWLSILAPMKDSLWSVELFRCESLLLRSHGVLVVMDRFTRRIIGFGTHAGNVDGAALCRMFNRAISGKGAPQYLRPLHQCRTATSVTPICLARYCQAWWRSGCEPIQSFRCMREGYVMYLMKASKDTTCGVVMRDTTHIL